MAIKVWDHVLGIIPYPIMVAGNYDFMLCLNVIQPWAEFLLQPIGLKSSGMIGSWANIAAVYEHVARRYIW
jgi:hypothetical protein